MTSLSHFEKEFFLCSTFKDGQGFILSNNYIYIYIYMYYTLQRWKLINFNLFDLRFISYNSNYCLFSPSFLS